MRISAAIQAEGDRDKPDQNFKHQARVLKSQLERLSRSEPLLLPFCVRSTRGSPGIRKLLPP